MTKHKITQLVPGKDGWSQWICASPKRFRMQCCKCGNTHVVQFRTFIPLNQRSDGRFEAEVLRSPFRTMYRARQGRTIR